MRKVIALARSRWLVAASYRLNLLLSMAMQLVSIVPVYFVARALQPVMADSIKGEGAQFFGFLVVGTIATLVVATAVEALPSAIQGGISNGTLEALLGTPTSLATVLAGLTGYEFSWTAARAVVILIAASLLGTHVAWVRAPESLLIVALIILAYLPVGILSGALVIAFRTQGPLAAGVLVLSSLLGGVYYPTHVIPTWIQRVSAFVPLTYGLRALRRVVLQGASLIDVRGDIGILLVFVVVLMAVSVYAFALALRYARRSGGLSQY